MATASKKRSVEDKILCQFFGRIRLTLRRKLRYKKYLKRLSKPNPYDYHVIKGDRYIEYRVPYNYRGPFSKGYIIELGLDLLHHKLSLSATEFTTKYFDMCDPGCLYSIVDAAYELIMLWEKTIRQVTRINNQFRQSIIEIHRRY